MANQIFEMPGPSHGEQPAIEGRRVFAMPGQSHDKQPALDDIKEADIVPYRSAEVEQYVYEEGFDDSVEATEDYEYIYDLREQDVQDIYDFVHGTETGEEAPAESGRKMEKLEQLWQQHKKKAAAVGTAALLAAGGFLGKGYVQEKLDDRAMNNLDTRPYRAEQSAMDATGGAPGMHAEVIAKAAHNETVSTMVPTSDGGENELNVFRSYDHKNSDAEWSSFKSEHSIAYAAMTTFSGGNPNFEGVKSSEKGALPVPQQEADQISDNIDLDKEHWFAEVLESIGIDNYDSSDPHQNAQVWMKHMNNLYAQEWENAPDGFTKEEKDKWSRRAVEAYVEGLNLKTDDGREYTKAESDAVANVIVSINSGFDKNVANSNKEWQTSKDQLAWVAKQNNEHLSDAKEALLAGKANGEYEDLFVPSYITKNTEAQEE